MTDSHDSTTASAIPRRGFLRQLCILPMIGGGVTLIGTPTAAAVPVTRDLLESYNTWLEQERRWLAWERAGCNRERFQTAMKVTWFDVPSAAFIHNEPMPSTRAALVLSAVGVSLAGGDHD